MVVSHHGADFLDFLGPITAIDTRALWTRSRWMCDPVVMADVMVWLRSDVMRLCRA